MQNLIIRTETPADYRIVEDLTREAFWNVYRPGCVEHYLLHRFRQDRAFIPELSLVLELDGKIIGHVMYVHSVIYGDDGSTIPVMTFGPISIAPEYQRQGYGRLLLEASMAKAEEMGAGAIAITGNILVYGKSGFEKGKNLGIRYEEDPAAEYFLVAELKPGYLRNVSGTFRDPDGYFVSEEAVEAFDGKFPPKEKLKLPGQLV